MSDNTREMPRPASLYVWTRADVGLVEVLGQIQLAESGAAALLYAPQACRAGRVASLPEGRRILGSGDKVIDLDDVFEARVFGESGELRWWNDPDSASGRAAWVSEESQPPKGPPSAWAAEPARNVECLGNRYLLWGERIATGDVGWSRLEEARIGTLDVPFDLGNTRRAYRNAVVVDERLVRFEPYPEGSPA
jgi:CRISPR-associated protein (TIGR03984 family)